MNPILEVQNLSKQYKNSDFRLNDISFSVPSGTIMGFVGENGAGKTTTIGCILGTLIKDGGAIKIFGQEQADGAPHVRDDIGVVYDSNHIPDHFNLSATQVASAMGHIYTNWDMGLFNEYMKKFNLPDKRKIKTFSRGMTMKLGLALALARHPKLLVLDEATAGLDPIVRDEVLEVLMDFVQDENNSILISSHITTDLEKIADYITFIHDGHIVFSEKKHELIDNYGIMRCKLAQFEEIDKADILTHRKRDFQVDVLVTDKQAAAKKYSGTAIDNATIDEIMLMLVKGEK